MNPPFAGFLFAETLGARSAVVVRVRGNANVERQIFIIPAGSRSWAKLCHKCGFPAAGFSAAC